MTPSQVKMIAFFNNVSIKDIKECKFINSLSCMEVTEELHDPIPEKLFAIYDKYAPDFDRDLWLINEAIKTLKEIENITFTFTDVSGNSVLNHYKNPIQGEF